MENNTSLLSPYFPTDNNYNSVTPNASNNTKLSITFDSIKSFGFVIIPVSNKFKHMKIRTDLINVPIQIYNLRTAAVNTSIELLQSTLQWKTGNNYSKISNYLQKGDFIVAAYDVSNLKDITHISDGIPIGFASVSIQLKKVSQTESVKFLHINKIYVNNLYKNTNPEIPIIQIINFIALNNHLYKVTLNSPLIKLNSYKQQGFYENIRATADQSDHIKLALKVINTNFNLNTRNTINNRKYLGGKKFRNYTLKR
jgi:hypothetical protein